MNPTIASSQANEQAIQPQHKDYTPEPSPNARPQVPAVRAVCNHWGRSTEHTCGVWECYLEWGC